MKPRWSIVMPVLDEAATLRGVLDELAPLRAQGAELIVVDGHSSDGTSDVAASAVVQVITATRGRASQMNAGAACAGGDVLIFLHADTSLPAQALQAIDAALRGAKWGRFDVEIAGHASIFKLIATLMNWRSRLSGIATGDQAMFVEHKAFDEVGGFPEQPLMEDIELSQRLRRRFGRPACVKARVVTSGRRWERDGIWPTILLMWRLRLLYRLGVAPERLARSYR